LSTEAQAVFYLSDDRSTLATFSKLLNSTECRWVSLKRRFKDKTEACYGLPLEEEEEEGAERRLQLLLEEEGG
jgi:hypothetical protein